MEIKILGTGCTKCKTLEKLTKSAIEELGIEASIVKEEDIVNIMQYGVMSTPGLVINEKVILSGRLPKMDEIKEILTQNSN